MPNGSKHWCFTLNNYTDDELSTLQAAGVERPGMAYLIIGKETGETGTPHVQGFVSFAKRRTLKYAKELLCSRGHFEAAKGSPKQAATYCKKDGDYEEFGECPGGRGTRTDLASALEVVKAGACRRVLIESFPSVYARSHRMLSEALLLYSKPRDWMPVVKIFWGDSGTGKTRRAFAEAESAPYVHSGGQWFDGYDGDENVIFDDFGGCEFKLTYLLKLLDRYPMRVPYKGGFSNWVPKNIWITSNYDPRTWYAGAKDEHQKALRRRIAEIHHFGNPWKSDDGSIWN